MNWFSRSLNWAYVIALGYYLLICYLIVKAFDFLAPFSLIPLIVYEAIGTLLALTIMIPVSIWVLKAKGRSLWWLFLAGFFSPLWLPNKKVSVLE